MPDITKCSGEGCLIKDNCFRFTSKPDDYQSYFNYPPFIVQIDDKFECEYFWLDKIANLKNLRDEKINNENQELV